MPKPTKTLTIATWPNGMRTTIIRQKEGWRFRDGAWSTPKSAAIEHAQLEGATITVEPNPYYDAELKRYEDARIRRQWNEWLGTSRF